MQAYGIEWNAGDKAQIEATLCRHGGRLKHGGKVIGNGLEYHFKALIKELAPWFAWHIYSNLIVDCWCKHDTIGIAGPASCSKTFSLAMCAYAEFFIRPKGTSIIMSSTTLEGLKLRVWGAMVEILTKVKERRPWAPGYLVASERRIYPQEPSEEELRDPRDAIMGIACKSGDSWVNLGSYVGLKNDYVIGVFDEASLMPRVFWDSTSNLRKNPKTKFVACGNPKDHTDALGVICEPMTEDGGWEGLPYSEKTRTWRTRGTNSIAIQLSGYDSPNYNYPRGVNPYPYLITPEQMEDDAARYGKDSWQYLMQNVGVWPMGASSQRVITRAMCEKGNAFGEPLWQDDNQVHVLGLDAAYSGAGGDRTPLIHLAFGKDINNHPIIAIVDGPIIVPGNPQLRDSDGKLVPIEDQIAQFVMDYAKRHGIEPSKLGFDSTGRGSLVSSFAQMWSPSVVAIEFGGKPMERQAFQDRDELETDLYGKMVTSLWFAVASTIKYGQFRGLTNAIFEEGTMREWIKLPGGRIDVEKKEDTIKRMGRSPDLFDSLACGIEMARRHGFNIGAEVTASRRFGKPWWLKKKESWLKVLSKQVLR